MVFELRRGKQDRLYYVRVYYVCQTLDQMRHMTPLSLDVPPAVAPIFIPDGSSSSSARPMSKTGQHAYEKLFKERTLRNLQRKARELGFDVTPMASTALVS